MCTLVGRSPEASWCRQILSEFIVIKGVGREERGQRQKPADSPEEQKETGNGRSMSLF